MVLLTAMVMAACSSAIEEPQSTDAPVDEHSATLILKVDRVDAPSRAADNDNIESASTLRIIIVGSNTVELNRLVDLDSYTPKGSEVYIGVYKLKPNENKTIYAIANPENCGFDFDSYPEGSTANISDALNSHAFTFNPNAPIPMSDSREIKASDITNGSRCETTLNLVRVATKFSVNITNKRSENVTLNSFSVSGLASVEYLMPHFSGTNGQYIVNTNGLMGFDFPNAGTDMHWSDWLKLASDESQANPTDNQLADTRGWIIKYAVPTNAGIASRRFSLNDADATGITIAKDKTVALPTHYFAESKSGIISSSSFGNGAASGWEQHYTFDIQFSSADTPGGTILFSNQPFNNLRALFRNTHVVLNITINQHKLDIAVRVVPYASVELRPEFGWPTLPDYDEKPDPDIPETASDSSNPEIIA